jgi:Family of unknown function (DUF6719)
MSANRNVPYLNIGTLAAIQYLALTASVGLGLLATPVLARQVSREQDIPNLRLGQRILVDDGSCPAGQIKEVLGSQMTTTGVVRTRKCVPRAGSKRR